MSEKDKGKGKMSASKNRPKKLQPTQRVDSSQQISSSLATDIPSSRATPSPTLPTNASTSQSTPPPSVPGVNSPNTQSHGEAAQGLISSHDSTNIQTNNGKMLLHLDGAGYVKSL